MKVVGIIIAVLVLIGGCCIGALFLGSYAMNEGLRSSIQPQVEGTPPVEKYIGKIESMDINWGQTAQQAQSGDEGRLALNTSGDKGTGLLIVKMADDGSKLSWAILEVDGKNYAVMGPPPEDLNAINLDGTPAVAETGGTDGGDQAGGSDAADGGDAVSPDGGDGDQGASAGG
ncbi:MAG: hypothetical protein VX641_02250 [Planctomycetota bacterium]|nr:hypothetical protein [Planctomycetota bacterium]